jgi:predicted MPP superfamily phosphohydrolase
VEYVVWMANRGRQDVTVLTGDYVHRNHTAADIRTVWPVLNKLTAPEGVFAVLGNHDHWADTQASIRALKASGFNLRHRSHLFERQGQRLWLAGTGDLWEDEQTMDTVFAGVSDDDCKILLAHNPDTADLPFVTKIDLMLSGHTHGGQVYFPFIGAPWAPVRNKAYMRGLVQTRRFPLFVSRGIGWAGYPLRFLSPPEMALIILRRE